MTGRPRTREHLEERASEKVSEANEMLRAGRDIAADRLAWDAAFLLTRARQS
jgi:hypothetical protein